MYTLTVYTEMYTMYMINVCTNIYTAYMLAKPLVCILISFNFYGHNYISYSIYESLFLVSVILVNVHSAVLILYLPIRSLTIFLHCVLDLQYWRDNIVLLCWSLNFSLNVNHKPFIVSRVSCSVLVRIWVKWRPSLIIQT